MKKNIIIIILTILVLGLTGFIIYDKTLSEKNDDNNYQENDYEQNFDSDMELPDSLKPKTYAACIKTEQLPDGEDFGYYAETYEYVIYILELKSHGRCTFTEGGINNTDLFQDSYGATKLPFTCPDTLPFDLEIDTIIYKPANVIMKKIDSSEELNYNFCKNNY